MIYHVTGIREDGKGQYIPQVGVVDTLGYLGTEKYTEEELVSCVMRKVGFVLAHKRLNKDCVNPILENELITRLKNGEKLSFGLGS
jgi:hypothetical protein